MWGPLTVTATVSIRQVVTTCKRLLRLGPLTVNVSVQKNGCRRVLGPSSDHRYSLSCLGPFVFNSSLIPCGLWVSRWEVFKYKDWKGDSISEDMIICSRETLR